MDGRGLRGIIAALVAVGLVLTLAGCGGSSSDGGSDDTKTTQGSDSSDKGDDGGDDTEAASDLPDPCEMVTLDEASDILGGESAEPDGNSSDLGTSSRSCSWQTQESVDNPSLDNAGHLLTLTVIEPPSEAMTLEEFFKASEDAADEKGDVDGCDRTFWFGGMLSALQDGVYVTGSAGLADKSAEAKQATTDLVSAACKSLS